MLAQPSLLMVLVFYNYIENYDMTKLRIYVLYILPTLSNVIIEQLFEY